eukprot:365402-Chlamydomonas_euryale.AAC.11
MNRQKRRRGKSVLQQAVCPASHLPNLLPAAGHPCIRADQGHVLPTGCRCAKVHPCRPTARPAGGLSLRKGSHGRGATAGGWCFAVDVSGLARTQAGACKAPMRQTAKCEVWRSWHQRSYSDLSRCMQSSHAPNCAALDGNARTSVAGSPAYSARTPPSRHSCVCTAEEVAVVVGAAGCVGGSVGGCGGGGSGWVAVLAVRCVRCRIGLARRLYNEPPV